MLIDAHAHLDRYDQVGPDEIHLALGEIDRERIFTISVSMDPDSYRRNLEIATMSEWVLPIFGVHPWNAAEHAGHLRDFDEAMEQSPMFGEIGLDHYFVEDAAQYPAQRHVLERFLAVAREQNKLVEVHTNGAERHVLDLLEQYNIKRAIVHRYSGPMDIFQRFVERGCYFTVGIDARHTDHVADIARAIPADRLLSETDNPGGPRRFVGGPGMPHLVQEVVEALALVRRTTAEDITKTVHANLLRLFQSDPWIPKRFVELLQKG